MTSSPASVLLAIAGGLLLLRAILSWKSLLYYLGRWWRWLDERTQAYQRFEIRRYNDSGHENPLFRRASAYVASLPSLEDAASAAIFSSGRKPNDFFLLLGPGHSAADSFLGSRLLWTNGGECLVLRVRRPDRTRVLRPYLQHVETVAEDLELRRREIRLFTNAAGGGAVPLMHPATLDTLAMDLDLKNRVKADLEAFLKGRSYYHRLGRVWRRSYLLYGPPGTGKSTFVAAMAKFLCYDVYDVDLSRFSDTSRGDDLKAFLLTTSPRSIILVEDLDRYLRGKNSQAYYDAAGGGGCDGDGESRLTGILNFMDGIFSCCGEERVMLFTMTTDAGGLEGMEPAVLRPGRLDVHIHFPLCDFSAFKTLASGYLGLKDHKLYPQVEEGFHSGAKISPAEVSEIMIANRSSPSRALKSVISALQKSAAPAARAPRLCESASARRTDETGRSDAGSCGVPMAFRREPPGVREFKKLYGLIKMKSNKEATLPVEVSAVAAAAAANGAALDGN